MSTPPWTRGPIVVLGAEGMLGRDLTNLLRERFSLSDPNGEQVRCWDVVGARMDSRTDIRDRKAVIEAIRRSRPAVVVNCAAYTDVDGCESHEELATAVNAAGVGNVADACRDVDALMVHISTDFIFDGRSRQPYQPADGANPLSVYGRSKWEGEEALRASGCRYLLVRTSWLFGPHGRNFVETILAKAEAGQPLSVVTDQIGRPTLTIDLSEGILRLLDCDAEGTFHFANSGHCSWFEFTEAIVRHAGLDVPIRPITSDELSRPACRPAYSVLDLTAYTERTGHVPALWTDALGRYLVVRTPRKVMQRERA